MYTLLVILIVLAALLMIGIVLIQESKGGGLASGFASANSVAGVRQTTNTIGIPTVVCLYLCAVLLLLLI